MKKLLGAIVVVTTAHLLSSCSGVRPASGPAGSVTPGYGSASNISSGRNATGVPLSRSNDAPITDASGLGGDRDSLSRKIDARNHDARAEQFVRQAWLAGSSAVQLSELANKRSQNAYVKEYAALIVKEQGAANQELRAIADAENLTLDSTLKDQDRYDKLEKLSTVTGEELEMLYIQTMIKDHQQVTRLYEKGTGLDNEALKVFARKSLPMLKIHYIKASAMNSK